MQKGAATMHEICHNARDHCAIAVRRNRVIIRHLPFLGLKKFKIEITVKQLQLKLTRICTFRYTCYNTANIVRFDNLWLKYFMLKIFHVFNFCTLRQLLKNFNTQNFPNYSMGLPIYEIYLQFHAIKCCQL